MKYPRASQCPSCYAPITILETPANIECQYCGSQFRVFEVEGKETIIRTGVPLLKEISLNQITDQEKSKSADEPLPAVPAQSAGKRLYQADLDGSSTKRIKRRFVEVLMILFVISTCLCLVFVALTSTANKSTTRAQSTQKALVTPPTPTPITPTPTTFYIPLPIQARSSVGLVYTITDLIVRTSLPEKTPDRDAYLIVRMTVENPRSESACIKMDEFYLLDGSDKIEMHYSELDPAKEAYKVDYPGAFIGQCIAKGKEESVLAFDVEDSGNELTLYLQGTSLLLGKFNALKHPPDTATPTITNTPKPTATRTATPTPLPFGTINPVKVSGGTVNIRSGPGPNTFVAWRQEVDPEVKFTLVGRNEDSSWLMIETRQGDRGWIDTSFVLTENDLELIPVMVDEFPTLTPTLTPTRTPTPTQSFAIAPPKGSWCEQNNTRGVCVGNLEYRNYVGYSSSGSKSRFVVLGAVVKNISYSDISVNPFDFTMVMEDGSTYEHSSETYYFNNAFSGLTVAPDNSAKGALVFLVPNDVGPVKIICRGGFFESNIVIDLRLKPED